MIIFFAIVCTILFMWTLWLLSKSKSYGCGCALVGMAIFAFLMGRDEETGFWEIATIVIIPIAIGLTVGLIYNNREEKRKKAAEGARKAREAERMKKSVTLSIWLSEVEYWLTPKEIKQIPYLPNNLKLTAYNDDATGKLKEIRVIVDKQTVGLIPKELEGEILPLIMENRITFATFPETYYNRKRCTGHVKMNLSYIPFDSDYCLS